MVSLVATFYAFKLLWPVTSRTIQRSLKDYLDYTASIEQIGTVDIRHFFQESCMTFLVAAMPLLLICSFTIIVCTVAQTRGLFTWKALEPKFNRMNPIEGIKRLFSLRGMVELVKSLAKIIILGYIIYNTLKKEFILFPRILDLTVEQTAAYTGSIILSIAKTAAIIMAFIAAGDFFYQWWDYEKNLRMSKEELKEEYKQTEGDPQIKGKIKERQQAQARQRMMQNVPNADVVIRNPTHYAVAIQYNPQKNNAPVVIAKGQDSLALRIVEVAEANGVVTMENKPLARGLYETVELDKEIPEQFYQPVAEVLAFVYNLKKKELR